MNDTDNITTMTFDKFLSLVNDYHAHYPEQRYGQSLMNVLWSVNPTLYEQVRAAQLDVFYTTDVAKIEQLVQYLETQFSS